MPGYKNSFESPAFIEQVVLDDKGKKLGTLRVKPSSVLWKPVGKQKFFSIPFSDFTAWVTDPATKAKQTSS
jgi:hypothetical protein